MLATTQTRFRFLFFVPLSGDNFRHLQYSSALDTQTVTTWFAAAIEAS